MPRLHCFGFAFTPKPLATIFFLLALPILLSLGVWQWHRADEKQRLQQQFRTQAQHYLKLNSIQKKALDDLRYRAVRVTGHYDNAHQFLLDNKIRYHRVGYEVLTPFIPNNSQQVLMINRGWIAGTGNRQRLPEIPASKGQKTIIGFIKPIDKQILLLSQRTENKGWPLVIQRVDLKKIESIYKRPLYPFVVLLSPRSPGGFIRDWQPIAMTPEKHLSYAVQWFALALTLVIIYLVLSIKRQRGRHDKTTRR